MSPKLALIARQFARSNPEKKPEPEAHGLGAAIEKLIADEVERRVGEVMTERTKEPAHVRRLMDDFNRPAPVTDYRQLPAVPHKQPMKAMDITFQRDELRRIAVVDMGSMQFRVQRGALGEIVRMVPIADAPMPPAIEPPLKASARQYNPGEPR